MSDTLEQKLEKTRIRLMRDKPFFGYILPRLEFEEIPEEACRETNFNTIGIDYKGKVVYNAKFLDCLESDVCQGVLCHELLHYALHHHIRAKDFLMKDLANIAQDLVINDIIEHQEHMKLIPNEHIWDFSSQKQYKSNQIKGFSTDKNGIFYIITQAKVKLPITVRGNSWEYVYDCLLSVMARDDMPQMQGQGGDSQDQSQGTNSDGAGGNSKSNKRSKQGQGSGQQNRNSFDQHGWAPDNMSTEEQQTLENEANNLFAEAKTFEDKKKNRSPDGDCWMNRVLNGLLQPQVSWKTLLRRAIQSADPYDFTYSKPNKRAFAQGYYIPSTLKEAFEVTLAVDVSGSISDKEFAMFMAEFKGILMAKPRVKVRTLFWSTNVDKKNDKIYTRSNLNDIQKAFNSVSTTGGTTMSCIEKYLKSLKGDRNKKALQTMVYLTDGYIESDPKLHAAKTNIFIITPTGDTSICKECKGHTIRLSERE